MKARNLIFGAIVAFVIILIGFFVVRSGKTSNEATTKSNTTSSSQTPAAATITYSESGFSPATVSVKSGDTVAITNSGKGQLQFESDPHPVHTDNPELNVGAVASGQTKTFTVTKTGTWGYHNHLSPSDKGSITVQ